ncbi:uncharacterized protein [Polyergus mexicanus]|uniref:uncharacterized protein n=1 Tax=Polyergus mexicanus TaxID=615972 RepID=UPI0038B515DD
MASVTRLVNNCAAFMFEEIRYKVDGVEIDRSRNVGITSTIKNYGVADDRERQDIKDCRMGLISGNLSIGNFNFCVPLNVLLGFCENYKRVVINARHELILAVKAVTQLEKPRYVIFALQSKKKNILSEEPSLFDNCKLTNVKLHLNSDFYPYDDMNLDFNKRTVAVLYDMYSKF